MPSELAEGRKRRGGEGEEGRKEGRERGRLTDGIWAFRRTDGRRSGHSIPSHHITSPDLGQNTECDRQTDRQTDRHGTCDRGTDRPGRETLTHSNTCMHLTRAPRAHPHSHAPTVQCHFENDDDATTTVHSPVNRYFTRMSKS